MNSAAHTVAPEQVMAFVDGELSQASAQAVAAHLAECAACAALAAQFRALHETLGGWTVPDAPASLEDAVATYTSRGSATGSRGKVQAGFGWSVRNWRVWAAGGMGAFVTVLLLFVLAVPTLSWKHKRVMAILAPQTNAPASAGFDEAEDAYPLQAERMFPQKSPLAPPPAGAGIMMNSLAAVNPGTDAVHEPMIARTISLTIVVKDLTAARAALDALLARHHGYAAQLAVEAQANSPRTLQATLRIPVAALGSAATELKALGHVEKESQTGEDVTQQHADLMQRLKTAHETEESFRALLQHTGKVADLLEVEEGIARVRGEIESMEAAQKTLEHRVDFATIELQLTEEYREEFAGPSISLGTRTRNAFVGSYRNALDSVLGIFLFVVEYGPAILIWIALLGVPAYFGWRRYRKMRARV